MENSLVVVIQERFSLNVLMFSMLNYCGLGFQDKKSMPSKTCVMLHTDNSAMCMNFVWKLLPIWDWLIVPRNRSGVHKVISWRRVLFGITFYFVLGALTCPTYVFHRWLQQSQVGEAKHCHKCYEAGGWEVHSVTSCLTQGSLWHVQSSYILRWTMACYLWDYNTRTIRAIPGAPKKKQYISLISAKNRLSLSLELVGHAGAARITKGGQHLSCSPRALFFTRPGPDKG